MATKENLFDVIEYRPEFGGSCLVWKKDRRCVKTGSIAGYQRPDKYWDVRVFGKIIRAHRLIWFLNFGEWPKNQIDHIDGNPENNKIENLREATTSQNQCNKRKQFGNKCGVKNVYLHKPLNKWRVRIAINKKTIQCGLYDDLELAELVAIEAREKYHGIYARHA
jgi:hypothetical protein